MTAAERRRLRAAIQLAVRGRHGPPPDRPPCNILGGTPPPDTTRCLGLDVPRVRLTMLDQQTHSDWLEVAVHFAVCPPAYDPHYFRLAPANVSVDDLTSALATAASRFVHDRFLRLADPVGDPVPVPQQGDAS